MTPKEKQEYFGGKPFRLKGRFVRRDAEQNKQDHYWEILDGEKVLWRSSVRQFCNADPSLSYERIATYEFGKYLLAKTRQMKVFW